MMFIFSFPIPYFCNSLSDFCFHFLKTSMVNKFVCAVPLGRTQDYEGVRLYTGLGQLVATILVEKHLVATAETYLKACEDLVPDVKSLIPSSVIDLTDSLPNTIKARNINLKVGLTNF